MVSATAVILLVKYKHYQIVTTDSWNKPGKEKPAVKKVESPVPPPATVKPSGLPRLKDLKKHPVPKRSTTTTSSSKVTTTVVSQSRISSATSSPSRSSTKSTRPATPITKPVELTPDLVEHFETYSKFGDKGSGKDITLPNLNKWLKDAGVIDGRSVTINDTAIFFKQVARSKRVIEQKEFQQFSEILIRNRKLDAEEFQKKLTCCQPSGRRSKRSSMSDEVQNAAVAPPPDDFKGHFKTFAKFGDIKSTGAHITLSNIDKWLKQAKIIDGKKVTTVDSGIYFKQKAKTKKNLTLEEFDDFLLLLCKNKKLDVENVKTKLTSCGAPGITRATAAQKGGAVDRLTDHKKFTGTHKQRFSDDGKGKGKQGRVDAVDSSGYVSGYKDKNTYDTTH